jgi:hypothetical protein
VGGAARGALGVLTRRRLPWGKGVEAPAQPSPATGAGLSRTAIALAALLSACAARPAPRTPDPALAAAASVAEVASVLGPGCRGSGAAVHLGGGRFLTAAHVVDGIMAEARGCRRGAPPAFSLAVAGTLVPAGLLRTGRGEVERPVGLRYQGAEDLALLAPLRPLPPLGAASPCAADPRPGQELLVVTRRRSERLRVVALAPEPDPRFGTYAEIPLAMAEGESGGGAFDAATGCLAGIVSHREDEGAAARTRLVPAGAIRRFLAR